ncbi:HET-domain-containing protein [Lentithecium fluviatile CBS 122367]|uniref:HET-domain-containing protein n=1 Tax=Lentithecium fluviatile CBS 122367 TaxID=1168545 RepID=A0A6G1J119_9PLEO|nr:HET-domain-containing protein [Lentithecium fluviatile CBS 122367]
MATDGGSYIGAMMDGISQCREYRQQRGRLARIAIRKWYAKLSQHSVPWLLPENHTASTSQENRSLCEICRQINFEWLFNHDLNKSYLSLRTSGPWNTEASGLPAEASFQIFGSPYSAHLSALSLGFFSDVLERENCAFCKFVADIILSHLGSDRVTCMTLHVDGYGEFPRVVDYPMTRTFCRIETAEKASSGHHDLRIWMSQDQGLSGDIRAFDIQRLCQHPNPWWGRRYHDQIDFSVLRAWIAKAASREKPFGIKDSVLEHFRLIDVRRRCVARASTRCRYIALSYVWGKTEALRNETSTEEVLSEAGSLTDEILPKTIADAIAVTAEADIPYLWVDSLCILQDNDPSKQIQIAAMDQIYSSAVATIVAASGFDAHAGLPGVRPGTRWCSVLTESVQSIALGSRLNNYSKTSMKPIGAFDYMWDTEWNTRAWTFQEFSLSETVIAFLDRITFCWHRGQIWTEDVWEPSATSVHRDSAAVSIASFADLLDVSKKMPCMNVSRYDAALVFYSSRKLSYDTDAINAFMAILALLRPAFRGDFLFGLPSTELEHGLLWRPEGILRLRSCAAGKGLSSSSVVFPSWSWAAWEGEVCMPRPNPRFSRITWFDPTDNSWFTSEEYRGYSGRFPQGWIRLKQKGVRSYTELGAPHAEFLHPVVPEDSRKQDNKRFILSGGRSLTFMALAVHLPMSPGRWCMERLKPFNYRHLSPDICSYTLRDLLGPSRVAGVVYLHNGVKPGEPFNQPYELIAISRGTHYYFCEKETGDPPADDYDLVQGVHSYEWEEWRKSRINWTGCDDEPAKEVHWGIYDVLVIVWDGDVAYRIGVGVCYARAFWYARPQWKRIVLG